jgi:hypothetical protein
VGLISVAAIERRFDAHAIAMRGRPPYTATMIRRRSALSVVAGCLVALAVLWGVATAGLYAAMRQTPERFGAIMSHVPGPAMMLFPFKPLWMTARAGSLQVGDPAPDFTLPTLHGERRVTLSSEYRQKPVVLIFGSYT